MTIDTNTSVQSRSISAFFDTQAAATKAVDDLLLAGIPRQQISQTGGEDIGQLGTAPARTEEKGFWESLKDMFMPEEDRAVYAEGLRRGGYLVSVRTDEADFDRVVDILDNDGAVDLNEREDQWRAEGWTSSGGRAASDRSAASGAFAPTTAPDIGSAMNDQTGSVPNATDGTTAVAASSAQGGTSAASPLAAGPDQVVPVYEENLRVGKRDVGQGRVRVRTHVVETPVNEQVSLHNEKVEVERRPVDRPVAADDTPFQNRIIEAEEHAEEAVISKEARVKEEVMLRKTAEDRVQNVADKVRHTEIEVEDDRSAAIGRESSRFSAAIDASRIVEHMDVISQDGQKVGTVDHLDGPDRIKLAKNTSPDGEHHIVPMSWIDHIDQHVHLKKTTAEVEAGW
jgi:stress response protein YsnF